MYSKKVIVFISLWLIVCLALAFVFYYIVYKQGKEYQTLKSNYDLLYKDYNTVNDLYCGVRNELDELKAKENSEVHIIESAYTEDEVYLLAQCVEAEAGENNFNSQKYITQVILNRVHSSKFPNTIEEVIYQKNGNVCQFTVAYNGAMNRVVKAETLTNVYKVLYYGTDLPKNVLFFYSASVKNNWLNSLPTHSVVEGTVFSYSN